MLLGTSPPFTNLEPLVLLNIYNDYDIFEAADAQSGLALYRSRRIDCVVLELSLHGAYTCLAKEFTTGEYLDNAIRRAVPFVGRMPKEDRSRQLSSSNACRNQG